MRGKLLLTAVLSCGTYAFASPIGTLGIGSSGVVNATITSILFTTDPAALGLCPGGTCNGDVNTGTNLTFSGGPLVTREGILINGGFAIGSAPPSDAQFFDPFLQFASHPFLVFHLGGVAPGTINTNCAGLSNGQTCSILVNGTPSPVVLQQSGLSGSNVSISFFGTATDGAGTSNWSGQFSASIPNMTPDQIAQFFCGADGACDAAEVSASPTLVVTSTSGSFFASSQSVPEPNTSVLLGAGLILLALTLRRVKVL